MTKRPTHILAILLATVVTVPVFAQTSALARFDTRWTPYLGCWRLFQENVRGNDLIDGRATGTATPAAPGVIVCVRPAAENSGVAMTTYAEGKVVLEQTIVADGMGHPIADSGCQGTQTNNWSRDGQRLFTTVEVACNGRPRQQVSGVTLLARGPAWVDIQAIKSDDDSNVRVRRYERTLERPAGVAELPADLASRALAEAQAISTASLSLEDVAEASAATASPAVEAMLVATGSRFNLNGKALKQLANGGVSANVIDLMVAQSFPGHFRVEHAASAPPIVSSSPAATLMLGTAQYPAGPYPFTVYDPFYYSYYYYSPFAFPYYWGNGYYYYGRGPTYYITNGGTTTIVTSSGAIATGSSSAGGRVVNGRGYTRVTPADGSETTASPSQQGGTGGRTVRSASGGGNSSSSGSGSSSGSSSSGSSSGGSVSSGGYSSGGSGDTGRTAQPR